MNKSSRPYTSTEYCFSLTALRNIFCQNFAQMLELTKKTPMCWHMNASTDINNDSNDSLFLDTALTSIGMIKSTFNYVHVINFVPLFFPSQGYIFRYFQKANCGTKDARGGLCYQRTQNWDLDLEKFFSHNQIEDLALWQGNIIFFQAQVFSVHNYVYKN